MQMARFANHNLGFNRITVGGGAGSGNPIGPWLDPCRTEPRSCVKIEVAVLGSHP